MTEALDDEYSKIGDIIYDVIMEADCDYYTKVQKKILEAGYPANKKRINKMISTIQDDLADQAYYSKIQG